MPEATPLCTIFHIKCAPKEILGLFLLIFHDQLCISQLISRNSNRTTCLLSLMTMSAYWSGLERDYSNPGGENTE